MEGTHLLIGFNSIKFGFFRRGFLVGVGEKDYYIHAGQPILADLIGIDPHALTNENPRLIDVAIANDGFRAQV